MRIVGVVQARNSEHDPDPAAFVSLGDRPALHHLLDRFAECQLLDQVVLDAAADSGSRPVVALAEAAQAATRRSDEPNLLKRLIDIAIIHGAEVVVLTQGRSPLISGKLIDEVICHLLSTHADFTSTYDPVAATERPLVAIEAITRAGLEKLIDANGSLSQGPIALAARGGTDLLVSYMADAATERELTWALSIDDPVSLAQLQAGWAELLLPGSLLNRDRLGAQVEQMKQNQSVTGSES